MLIRINLDPSLSLRMTNWMYIVILRTEGTKNLGFEILKQKSPGSSGYAKVSLKRGIPHSFKYKG